MPNRRQTRPKSKTESSKNRDNGSCLCEQLQAYQKQLRCTQEELTKCQSRLNTSCHEHDVLKNELTKREDTISSLKIEIENLICEFKEKDHLRDRTCKFQQETICQLQNEAKQRDAILLRQRNDIASHLVTIEETRANCACELQHMELSIQQFKDELVKLHENIKTKTKENSYLERQQLDLEGRLHHTINQAKEWENMALRLQEEINQLECQSSKEKENLKASFDALGVKLERVNCELMDSQSQKSKLQEYVNDKENELKNVVREMETLSGELEAVKEESRRHRDADDAKRSDNEEICRLLQHRVDYINKLEERLAKKEDELQKCQYYVDELSDRIRNLNTNLKRAGSGDTPNDMPTVGEVGDLLGNNNDKVKLLESKLEETTEKLDWAVKEMECQAKESRWLNCRLEEAKNELFEQTATISKQHALVDSVEREKENLMSKIDEQLQKYEREIKEKDREIVAYGERCSRFEHSAEDKDLEIKQMHQQLKNLSAEIQVLNSSSVLLRDTQEDLLKSLKEKKSQHENLCREHESLQEKFQKQSQEHASVMKDLTSCQQHLDTARRDACEANQTLQAKELELTRMKEEKKCCVSKLSNLQCRLDFETSELTKHMSDLKCTLGKEIDHLKSCQLELEGSNAGLMHKVSSSQRQLAQMEKSHNQKMEVMTRENASLKAKIIDKDKEIQTIKDVLMLKESEIVRLKLRMNSMERNRSNCSKVRSITHGLDTYSSSQSSDNNDTHTPSQDPDTHQLDTTYSLDTPILNEYIENDHRDTYNVTRTLET